MNIFYYDIAVGLPLRQCFTYKSKEVIKKGKRVIVPFGSKSIVGIVVKKIAKPKSLKGLKEIISIADEYSCFNRSIFETIKWASDYYHHPIGEVFFSFIPTLLRKQNDKIIIDIDDNTASGRLSALRREIDTDSDGSRDTKEDMAKRLDSFFANR